MSANAGAAQAADNLTVAHLCLFNRAEFAQLNLAGGQRYHRVDVRTAGRLTGSLAGMLAGDTFISGWSAGFGGIDLPRNGERLETVLELVAGVLAQLRADGVRTVRIRAKPFHYSANEALLHFALLRNGFTIEEAQLNYFFDLTRYDSVDDYRRALRHAPRRQVQLAAAQPYAWSEAGDDWQAAYEVLRESRERNGATLSLSFAYVSALRQLFAGRIKMFVLSRDGAIAAACLMYAVLHGHAMVMFWGDKAQRDGREGSSAPIAVMNLVALRVVETGLERGLSTIDLGPVTSAGGMNLGNARFKASVDAEPNFRYTLSRTL